MKENALSDCDKAHDDKSLVEDGAVDLLNRSLVLNPSPNIGFTDLVELWV
jgi:hypothetical protein